MLTGTDIGVIQECELALVHFDLVPERSAYGLDFFSTLRYLIMESKTVSLLIQSRNHFVNLLPSNHPLSAIDMATVELKGLTLRRT